MTDLLHIVPGLGPALEQPTDGTDATATAITLTPNDIHEILTRIGLLTDDEFD